MNNTRHMFAIMEMQHDVGIQELSLLIFLQFITFKDCDL